MEITESQFEELIIDFCHRIISDFEEIRQAYSDKFPSWKLETLAVNLMEYGRGQISQIDEPDDTERSFMLSFIGELDTSLGKASLYQAYASGCLTGLVSSRQLERHMLIAAMEIAALVAKSRFAPDAFPKDQSINMFLKLGDTAWEYMKTAK